MPFFNGTYYWDGVENFEGKTFNGQFFIDQKFVRKKITDLKGCPKIVKGDFKIVEAPHLKTLKGAPKEVAGEFECTAENLKSLKYCPEKVESLYISFTGISNFEGVPKEVNSVYCGNCPLTSLNGFPQKVNDYAEIGSEETLSLKGIENSEIKTFFISDTNLILDALPKSFKRLAFDNCQIIDLNSEVLNKMINEIDKIEDYGLNGIDGLTEMLRVFKNTGATLNKNDLDKMNKIKKIFFM